MTHNSTDPVYVNCVRWKVPIHMVSERICGSSPNDRHEYETKCHPQLPRPNLSVLHRQNHLPIWPRPKLLQILQLHSFSQLHPSPKTNHPFNLPPPLISQLNHHPSHRCLQDQLPRPKVQGCDRGEERREVGWGPRRAGVLEATTRQWGPKGAIGGV